MIWKDWLVMRLSVGGPASARSLEVALHGKPNGRIRYHMNQLKQGGLTEPVGREPRVGCRGQPSTIWGLTAAGEKRAAFLYVDLQP